MWRALSPHLRESNVILDWTPHHGFRIPGTGFPSLSVELGFWIPWAVFRIVKPWIPNSTSKSFADSGFHKQNIPDSEFHKQNFSNSGIRIPLHRGTFCLKKLCFLLFALKWRLESRQYRILSLGYSHSLLLLFLPTCSFFYTGRRVAQAELCLLAAMVRSWLWNCKQIAMTIIAYVPSGIIVARARVLAAMPPLLHSFTERSERRITSWDFKASPPGSILRTSSQLLCSKTFLTQTIPLATQAMIVEVQWGQHNASFRVFSIYVGCRVERIWHATDLWIGKPKLRPAGPWFPANFVSAREPPPPPPHRLFHLSPGLDFQPWAVSLCWLHLDMIWAILLHWGLCISAVWSAFW